MSCYNLVKTRGLVLFNSILFPTTFWYCFDATRKKKYDKLVELTNLSMFYINLRDA